MIKDLQGIFEVLGCKHYEKDGKLTKTGNASYKKLVDVLNHLQEQGLITYNIDKLDKYVDEVIRLGF